MNRWTDADSDALDRQIIALRMAHQVEQGGRWGRRPSRVKPTRSGRWVAVTGHPVPKQQRTFDTEAEAQAWLEEMRSN